MAAEPVTASVFVEAAPERVYEYFTRPELIVRWMGDYALLEPERGGRFVLDIRGTPVRGRYLELEPPHRLLISWGYASTDPFPSGASTLEVQLIAESDGTRVVLEHRDLSEQQKKSHLVGWTHYLARLQRAGADRDAGPDPGMPLE
jgi:uncharacterized protein YndB with AHSA1/START domain